MVKYKLDYDIEADLFLVKRRYLLFFWKTYAVFGDFKEASVYYNDLIAQEHGRR